MLLSLTTTHQSALDLGYLLHKHPDRLQSFDLSFGRAHVFYPEAGTERCGGSTSASSGSWPWKANPWTHGYEAGAGLR